MYEWWIFDQSTRGSKKISSAQNTILCREWLLQKLTFRHSEITIFNHSQNPTQRTFGEPPAPSVYIYICLHDHGIMVFVKLIFAHGVAIKKCEHVKLESSAANEAIALLRQEYAEQRQLLLSEAGAEVQALRSEVQNLKCGNPNENAGTMAW